VDDLTRLRKRYAADHLHAPRWSAVRAAGVRCEVLAAGDGPPLVLVHGGMAHCTQWVPLIAQLSGDFRCYAVERPSNGASEALDHRPIVDRLAHVSGIMGDLLDGIGVQRAPIIGNSLGGLYALGFATCHPDRVEHLILAGAPAAHDHPVPLAVRLVAGRVTGRLLQVAMARMSPAGTRRGEAQLLVANAERLSDDYLELGAATTRRNAEVWPGYLRWAIQGKAIHPDMPASEWAATAARWECPSATCGGPRTGSCPSSVAVASLAASGRSSSRFPMQATSSGSTSPATAQTRYAPSSNDRPPTRKLQPAPLADEHRLVAQDAALRRPPRAGPSPNRCPYAPPAQPGHPGLGP
jgi:pimeloyl-ACP methyl ester carboxylesterase